MKKGFWIICLATLFFTSVPLVFGLKNAPPGMEFLGRRYLNSQDTPTYFSFIEEAKQGDFLFQNLYTTEKPAPRFFRPSYLLIGKTAQVLRLPNPWAFHLFRLLFGVAFFVTAYFFFSFFFAKETQRLLALIILAFSSGLGFVLEKFIPQSTDLWVPEANTFLTLSDSPHFVLSQTLMLLVFTSFLWALKKPRPLAILLGGGAAFLLAFEHPFALAIIYLTFGLLFVTYLSWQNKIPKSFLKIGAVLLLPSILGVIYYFFLLKNPVMAAWSKQNVMPSPSFLSYLSGFGLLLPLAVLGILPLLKIGEEKSLLLLSWILATGLLLYSPFPFQRRFVEGAHLPLTVLATFGLGSLLFALESFFKKAQLRLPLWRPVFLALLILLLSLTNIKNLLRDRQVFSADKPDAYYYYLLKGEAKGFFWLRENVAADKIILASWFYGNLIPGFTGRRVFLGHQVQTIDFEKKRAFLDAFFSQLTDEERQNFLRQEKIDYLFFGKDDYFLRLGGFKPEEKDYLRTVYRQDGVQIFAVVLEK